eukprot:TRINITY_DN66982_c6_g5_i1.p1 TRINITY_DN66982_c6_g5~~TRINITY_DN66982_c6_g5_i1.p1  ORF type:complete len:345 (-),score=6.38 TRINITY_DN66982_c6_g5_i1:540-1508(-)
MQVQAHAKTALDQSVDNVVNLRHVMWSWINLPHKSETIIGTTEEATRRLKELTTLNAGTMERLTKLKDVVKAPNHNVGDVGSFMINEQQVKRSKRRMFKEIWDETSRATTWKKHKRADEPPRPSALFTQTLQKETTFTLSRELLVKDGLAQRVEQITPHCHRINWQAFYVMLHLLPPAVQQEIPRTCEMYPVTPPPAITSLNVYSPEELLTDPSLQESHRQSQFLVMREITARANLLLQILQGNKRATNEFRFIHLMKWFAAVASAWVKKCAFCDKILRRDAVHNVELPPICVSFKTKEPHLYAHKDCLAAGGNAVEFNSIV